MLLKKGIGRRSELISEVIEGDEIYVEYTKAKVVRGNKVVIGPGCDIQSVEYREDFKALKDGNVKENKKI